LRRFVRVFVGLSVLLGAEFAVSPARAGLMGTVGLGVGPGETSNMLIDFASSSTRGVRITKVTFNTTAEGVVVAGGSGGGILLDGVKSAVFFSTSASVFGLKTTGFSAGGSVFDANLNLVQPGGTIAFTDLPGTKVTVDFSNGQKATAKLSTLISGSNSLGSYSDYVATFDVHRSGGSGSGTTATPEPSTLITAGIGILCMVVYGRWRKPAA
jgi:PEP-CTERM motif